MHRVDALALIPAVAEKYWPGELIRKQDQVQNKLDHPVAGKVIL